MEETGVERLDVRIDGSVRLDRDVEFHGVIIGSVTIARGRTFELYGTICHDLVVEAGAIVTIHGSVAGTLKNHGGNVHVFGEVGSVLDYDAKSPTHLPAHTATAQSR